MLSCVLSGLIWIVSILLTISGTFLIILKLNKDLQEWFFAKVVFGYCLEGTTWAQALRDDTLRGLTAIINEKGRVSKTVRLLEIGAGTGANFKYMEPDSDDVKVIVSVVDPNEKFKAAFTDKLGMYPNLRMGTWYEIGAEEMDKVAEEGSYDIVVTTHILCSVSDQKKAIEQIHRVLAPGGRAFLMEHVFDTPDHPWIRIAQSLLDPIWAILFCGCRLTRNTGEALRQGGFTECDLKPYRAHDMPFILRQHVYGHVTK